MHILKRKIFYIIPVMVVLILIAPEKSGASVSMTLEQYIGEILLNNHSLKAAIKSVEADYYSVLASVAYQRPSTNFAANGSYVTAQSAGNAKEYNVLAGNAKFTLTQRIDISGQYKLDEQQNILGYEVSRANFDNNLNSLIAGAEELWWSAVLARENMKLQREIMLQRAENHRVTMEKYNQELVPRLDIVRSEAQVVEAQSLSKTAETAYMNLLAELSLMAGGLDVEPVDEELKVPEFDISMDYDEALAYRPDVRAARLNLERAKLVKKLTAKGLSPTLDFAFQWTAWSDPEAFATPNDKQAGASLTLTFPISDGNGTKYKTLNADRLIQAAEANLDALQEQTRRDITVAINDWRNASANEQDKQRQVERSEEELKITELMYSEGMGAQIDLINAQTAYQAVRTEYLDAVKDMYIALVALRKAIGDYSPNEDGSWKEARQLYGKGNDVIGEPGFKVLRTDAKKGNNKPAAKQDSDLDLDAVTVSDSYSHLTEAELDARLSERLKTFDSIKSERGLKKDEAIQ
ncbi:MAG: TolC family protein [Synergistaceae bacterium]|nr:TolC family protein [Synergistaceae bacterium]